MSVLTKGKIEALLKKQMTKAESDRFAAKAYSKAIITSKNILELVLEDLNEEHTGFLNIIMFLSDGKPRRWAEVKQATGLSDAAISKRLKKLQKLGVLKRKLIPTFPPRTTYELDRHTDPGTYKWLVGEAELWKAIKEKIGLEVMLSIIGEKTKQLTTNELFQKFRSDIDYFLLEELLHAIDLPIHKAKKELVHISTSFFAVQLLTLFWSMREVLTVSDARRREIKKILSPIVSERQKEIELTEKAFFGESES